MGGRSSRKCQSLQGDTRSRLSSTRREPNCISHCSQTVPSRSWNVPYETFMHHIFLHLSSSEGLREPEPSPMGCFMRHIHLCTGLTMRLSRPRGWANHLCLTIAPAIHTDLDALYTILINRVYIAQGLCSHAAHPHDGICPAFSPYSKSLVPRSVCKEP